MRLVWNWAWACLAVRAAHAQVNPDSCPGYSVSNFKANHGGATADLTLSGSPCNIYGSDIKNLKLQVEYQSKDRLHVKIYDAEEQMFQVPSNLLQEPKSSSISASDSDLVFSLGKGPFSFSVKRKSSGQVLFDTTGHALVFESQYLRLRTALSDNPNIYGLGEDANRFRHDPANYSHPFWNAGEPFMPQNTNLYGFFPVYFDHRGANGSHAVYLRNGNGMRVNMGDDGGHYLEYNAIGGVFDFYFLGGPTPKEASAQLADVVGYPVMMPYWTFGFHQCRFGYQDAMEVAGVIANYSTAKIPLETVWNDLDYMNRRATYTTDPVRYARDKFKVVTDYLHAHDQHYITVVEPPIVSNRGLQAFKEGVEYDAFMKYPNGSTYIGMLWGGPSAFPDYFAAKSQDFWDYLIGWFYDATTGVDVDGLWLDMDEASNFCDGYCNGDPAQLAIQQRNPPRPPPARMYSPYKIPGFPKEFQPGCFVTVTFDVFAPADNGEDLLLVGDALSMGNNDGYNASQFQGLGGGNWTMTVQLPANSEISYSYVRYTVPGVYVPEKQNRTIKTGPCGDVTTVHDNSPIPGTAGSATAAGGNATASSPKAARGVEVKERSGTPMQKVGRDVPGRNLLNPPYDIKGYYPNLSTQALPTDLRHVNGYAEYDVHNFYASMDAAQMYHALVKRRPGKRAFLLSRSSIIGDGSRLAHWFGDNRSIDDDYRLSIIQMIQFPSMYQMPMVGSDICGFNYDTNPTLCARWAVLGAWNPFMRNHAEISTIYQEFYRWDVVADAARKALATRYRLLDYMYTNLYRQSTQGLPMLTPLVWEYPHDDNTMSIDMQFFFGDAFLVSPVTTPNSTSVDFYMPKDTFYDFDTLQKVQGNGATVTRTGVGYSEIPVHIRGGNVVPLRVSGAYTTTALRKEDFELIIAPDANGKATGQLYLDDGESIEPTQHSLLEFTYDRGILTCKGTYGYDPNVKLAKITLLGATESKCQGYSATSKTLVQQVKMPLTKAFTMNVCR